MIIIPPARNLTSGIHGNLSPNLPQMPDASAPIEPFTAEHVQAIV